MNDIINKSLLAGDNFMPETHLRQSRVTYSAGGTSTKNKDLKKIFKETRDARYICQNVCFQHDMVSRYFKNLNRKIFADKVLQDFILLKIQNKMHINVDFLQWFILF